MIPPIRVINSFDKEATKLIQGLSFAVTNLAGMIALSVSQEERLGASLDKLADAIDQISKPQPIIIVAAGHTIHIPGLQQGDDMSYTVPRDQPNAPFTLDPIVAQDSEGPVEVEFTERLESSNPDVVAVVGDAPSQELHFGTNGGATLNRIVTFKGTDFILDSAVFNVTPGDVTFSGGKIQIPGLTPDPEQPPTT